MAGEEITVEELTAKFKAELIDPLEARIKALEEALANKADKPPRPPIVKLKK